MSIKNTNIDIVYTWVNSSDKKWQKKYKIHAKEIDEKRFTSHNELKYSLRSIYKYAKWINNIFIVTDDQIPHWLNTKHPKIKIIDHKQIFENKKHLPTFNSQAIECHINNIPNLSERFFYFNDDTFLGNYLKKSDIIDKKLKISYMKNVDNNCNLINEDFFRNIFTPELHHYSWHNSQKLLNSKFPNRNVNCNWHQGILLKKSLFKDIKIKYKKYFDNTSSSKFRSKTDITPIRFIYEYVNCLGITNQKKFTSFHLFNGSISNLNLLLNQKPTFFCVNCVSNDNEKEFESIMNEKFPKCPFEL